MECTDRQLARIEQLLEEMGVYYSSLQLNDGVIEVSTGRFNEIASFDAAMTIISRLTALDRTMDSDYLTESAHGILEGEGEDSYDEEDEW